MHAVPLQINLTETIDREGILESWQKFQLSNTGLISSTTTRFSGARIIGFTISLVVLTVTGGQNADGITLQPTLSFNGESVLRFLGLITSILLVLSCFTAAQDYSKVDMFGGYQFTHVALGHDIHGFKLNCWNASLGGYFSEYLGVSSDSSGNYGSPFGQDLLVSNWADCALPNCSKMTPLGHVLFGGAYLNLSTLGIGGSDNSLAWAMGGEWTSTKIPGFRYAWRRLIG